MASLCHHLHALHPWHWLGAQSLAIAKRHIGTCWWRTLDHTPCAGNCQHFEHAEAWGMLSAALPLVSAQTAMRSRYCSISTLCGWTTETILYRVVIADLGLRIQSAWVSPTAFCWLRLINGAFYFLNWCFLFLYSSWEQLFLLLLLALILLLGSLLPLPAFGASFADFHVCSKCSFGFLHLLLLSLGSFCFYFVLVRAPFGVFIFPQIAKLWGPYFK